MADDQQSSDAVGGEVNTQQRGMSIAELEMWCDIDLIALVIDVASPSHHALVVFGLMALGQGELDASQVAEAPW